MERRQGFVLAGGRSRRMGCDKATLDWRGEPLVDFQRRRLERVAGSCVVIDAATDLYPGEGPLGGLLTALAAADCALVLACDMPLVREETLTGLLARAEGGEADAVIPRDAAGRMQPLAAVYRGSAREPLGRFFAAGGRRVVDAVAGLRVAWWDLASDEFRSMNTPAEYAALREN